VVLNLGSNLAGYIVLCRWKDLLHSFCPSTFWSDTRLAWVYPCVYIGNVLDNIPAYSLDLIGHFWNENHRRTYYILSVSRVCRKLFG